MPVEALVSVPPLPIGDLSVTDDNDQQNVMSEPVAAAGVEEPSSGNADQAGTEIPRGDMASILSPEGTFMGDKTAPIEGSSPKKSIRALSGDGSPEPYDSEEARQYMEESAASRAKNAERCLHSDVLSGPDHNFYDKSVPIEGSTPRKPLVRSSSPQPFDKSVTQQNLAESAASRTKNAQRSLNSDIFGHHEKFMGDMTTPIEGSTPRTIVRRECTQAEKEQIVSGIAASEDAAVAAAAVRERAMSESQDGVLPRPAPDASPGFHTEARSMAGSVDVEALHDQVEQESQASRLKNQTSHIFGDAPEDAPKLSARRHGAPPDNTRQPFVSSRTAEEAASDQERRLAADTADAERRLHSARQSKSSIFDSAPAPAPEGGSGGRALSARGKGSPNRNAAQTKHILGGSDSEGVSPERVKSRGGKGITGNRNTGNGNILGGGGGGDERGGKQPGEEPRQESGPRAEQAGTVEHRVWGQPRAGSRQELAAKPEQERAVQHCLRGRRGSPQAREHRPRARDRAERLSVERDRKSVV